MTTPLDRLREVVAQAKSEDDFERWDSIDPMQDRLLAFLTSDGGVEEVAEAVVNSLIESCVGLDGCYAVADPDAAEVDGEFSPRVIATAILSLLASKALGE